MENQALRKLSWKRECDTKDAPCTGKENSHIPSYFDGLKKAKQTPLMEKLVITPSLPVK